MIDTHPENERARALYAIGTCYDNMTAAMHRAKEAIADAQASLDMMVEAEFPIGTIVTVENVYQGARFIRGPVISHSKETGYRGAGLVVRNEKTGVARHVDLRNFIFKEATQ